MKNSDTVQLVILIVAIIAGYHAIIEIPQLLWLIVRWFDDGLNLTGYFPNVITSIIYLGINIASVFILIHRSRQIAKYIVEKSDYAGELNISQTKDELLSIVFIATGVYILITTLPDLFMSLYNRFHEKNGRDFFDPGYIMPRDNIAVMLIKILFAIIIIVYSKQFTDYFNKKRDNDAIEEIGNPENNLL